MRFTALQAMLWEAIAGSDRLWTALDATVMRVPRKLDAVRNQIVRTRVGQTPADAVLAQLCPGNRVRSGLCAGLQFPATLSAYNARGPMLLGCYERVLQDRLICLCADRRHDRVIDIGCAEGFYAVGLAKRLHVPVIAFDCDPQARAVCREMAALNEATIDLRDAGTPEALREALKGAEHALILCDCEGYERELFTDGPALAAHDLAIEVHDCLVYGISDQLHGVFARTHVLEWLRGDDDLQAIRTAHLWLPELENNDWPVREALISEHRRNFHGEWLIALSRM